MTRRRLGPTCLARPSRVDLPIGLAIDGLTADARTVGVTTLRRLDCRRFDGSALPTLGVTDAGTRWRFDVGPRWAFDVGAARCETCGVSTVGDVLRLDGAAARRRYVALRPIRLGDC